MMCCRSVFEVGFKKLQKNIFLTTGNESDDIHGVVENDLYVRDILKATQKLAGSATTEERVEAAKTIGICSWTGATTGSQCAGNFLVNLVGILNNQAEPTLLKVQVVDAVSMICRSSRENQDKARSFGMMDILHRFLGNFEAGTSDLRKSSAACLFVMLCNNYENQKIALQLNDLYYLLLELTMKTGQVGFRMRQENASGFWDMTGRPQVRRLQFTSRDNTLLFQ